MRINFFFISQETRLPLRGLRRGAHAEEHGDDALREPDARPGLAEAPAHRHAAAEQPRRADEPARLRHARDVRQKEGRALRP